jgi:hypothetical protein
MSYSYRTADFLPTIENFPYLVARDAGFGYILGKIADSSPSQWAKIYVISSIACHTLFLTLSIPLDNLREMCILYSFTNATFSTINIIALRHFNLIGTTGTVILGTLTCWTFIIHLKTPR